MYISTMQDHDRKDERKREFLPRIVQLGGTLPTSHADTGDIWTPVIPEKDEMTISTYGRAQNVKCAKYKNLYEYDRKHKNMFSLKKNLWKIPSLGNNFLPFQKKSQGSSEEVIGLYRPKFHRWYSRLVHENTVVLPPIETSRRANDNVHDPSNLNEKKYIAEQHHRIGPRERFTRDELYIPDVYSQCLTCRECRKQYANDVFVQSRALRADCIPICNFAGDSRKRTMRNRQHCDVLGERYCKSCMELRNKDFSLQLEDKLLINSDLKQVHFKSAFF